MATPLTRGTSSPVGSSPDAQRSALAGGLGDANLQNRALGEGRVQGGEAVGKQDAVYVNLAITSAKSEYDVPHTLGRKPGYCSLVGSANSLTPGSHYHVNGINRDKWTATNVRISVYVLTGSADSGQLTLRIGGTQ
jgi:hypothetical protein